MDGGIEYGEGGTLHALWKPVLDKRESERLVEAYEDAHAEAAECEGSGTVNGPTSVSAQTPGDASKREDHNTVSWILDFVGKLAGPQARHCIGNGEDQTGQQAVILLYFGIRRCQREEWIVILESKNIRQAKSLLVATDADEGEDGQESPILELV